MIGKLLDSRLLNFLRSYSEMVVLTLTKIVRVILIVTYSVV